MCGEVYHKYMATRYYNFAEGEFYHVYNRGNGKQKIFLDSRDYRKFLELMYVANGTNSFVSRDLQNSNAYEFDRGNQQVAVGAYCLMPNHFHMLLTPLTKDGVSNFMLKLGTSYAMYFNKKSERSGSLFEGSFKSKHASSDQYLKYLFSYIHLNPFRKEVSEDRVTISKLLSYKYSSLPMYLGKEREEKVILSPEKFPQYFQNTKEHHEELVNWLDEPEI